MRKEEVTPRGCLLREGTQVEVFMKHLIWALEKTGDVSGAMLGASSALSYFILRITLQGTEVFFPFYRQGH